MAFNIRMGREFITNNSKTLILAMLLLGIILQALTTPMALASDSARSAKNNTSNSESSRSSIVYFGLADQQGLPVRDENEVFDCTDKIYTVIELQGYAVGAYHLSVRWNDPSGDTREHTQYKFHVNNTNARLWAWLSLSRAPGAGMLQWLNPAAGLEEFIGLWNVTVKINDKTIHRGDFEISC